MASNLTDRSKRRTVADLEVVAVPMSVDAALELLPDVARVVTAVLAAGESLDADAEALGPVLLTLKGAELRELAGKLLAGVTVTFDGKFVPLDRREMRDLVFAGRIKTLLTVCWFAIQVTYADFFDGASATAGEPAAGTAPR